MISRGDHVDIPRNTMCRGNVDDFLPPPVPRGGGARKERHGRYLSGRRNRRTVLSGKLIEELGAAVFAFELF